MASNVYQFSIGEWVWFPPEVVEQNVSPLIGQVVKLGPPTGLFGNYGVFVNWQPVYRALMEGNPRWHDDVDLTPVPAVELLALLAAGKGLPGESSGQLSANP